VRGICDTSPEDIAAYRLPDPNVDPVAAYIKDHPGSEWIKGNIGSGPKCEKNSDCTSKFCERGICNISEADREKYGFM
jgi:hypothetical protein